MDQERRQYFRINGNVSLDYKVVSETEMEQGMFPSKFEVSPFFTLLTQLQELDHDSSYQLRKISQKDPALSLFLESLNAKIDAIARVVAANGMEFENLSRQNINLSEGGMSFISNEPVQADSYLAMKLVFEDNLTGLLVYGRVLHCVEQEDDFKIGIEFTDMPESSRTIVARHILSCQAKELQQHDQDDGEQ